ncbi:TPA: GDP-mannose mannosyl hydrolase [Enterobacter cloacae]|uniref:GDP-mannose mannosyl hydrolase n=1 Tax=Enterobacter cloacae TaxID=550 RepID=UPI0011230D6C|nr:GDP-mannose mannosyl hydrolase [Enterobacter cloacae]MCF2229947.1 GDP-mannose mannosyl hydrolase [Enterobacter cloacae]MDV5406140.1 GDP-mannose mannosyl hydrolase [Enterobacter cloacae]TOZ47415.1 GDP-mannose mannosyl hydrolase [Enterobacter cloacae]HEC5276931.1 GDP-mannose mannosyl hydrolase [Enterobacter cloacae]
MRLERGLFQTIVKNAPLISIDLIVKNNNGKVLLGQRLNRPAQDYWFVPGGRIFKDELLDEAFKRIGTEELGLNICRKSATFLGIYEHFYIDNFSEYDFSTHYIVHGYEITIDIELLDLPSEQHGRFQWFRIDDLLNDSTVHQFTKNYFIAR